MQIHETFQVSKLKLSTDRTFSKLNPIVIPTEVDSEQEYEVEKLLDHRYDARTKQWRYLVQWKGYSPLFHSTWEPRENLSSAQAVLKAYEQRHGIVAKR